MLYVYLHPTMYLLIRTKAAENDIVLKNLHPTMYLLIQNQDEINLVFNSSFTSHYVSINSAQIGSSGDSAQIFTSHYVSINSIKILQESLE